VRIFLTGATGYLGGALVRRLAQRRDEGHDDTLIALVRETSDTAELERLGVQLAVGDVADRLSMREGMAGADWVVHAAALVDLEGEREAMTTANVVGCANVASLAFKLGVGRMLDLSSIASFGGSPPDGSPGNEESPVREPFPSLYAATKNAGERRVREWAERGLRLNVVYPSLIYGPPGKKSGSNVLLRAIAKGRMPVLVGGDRRTSWVHLDDVVTALVRILADSEPGRDYLLAGEIVTVRSLAEQVCALAGISPPRLRLPVGAARMLATVVNPIYRLRGYRSPLSKGQLESLSRHWAFSDARARSELDWQPRGLAEGLAETVPFLLSR
jgi:dihydroflavonol-4-reductase